MSRFDGSREPLLEVIDRENVNEGGGAEEAWVKSARLRLRPVAMTVLATAFALAPLLFLRRRHSATGFLGLFVLLTLVGGGIGHVVFFLAAWAYATRMRSRLPAWSRLLGPRTRAAIAPVWLPALATSSFLFLVALEVSVFGILPGVTGPDAMLTGIWLILLASLVTLNLAYVAAIARDLRPTRAAAAPSPPR